MLGFDAVATGHHARVDRCGDGRWRCERGADRAKDQSYVVHMLGQAELARTLFPVGTFADKAELRALAAGAGSAHRRQARQPGRLLHHLDRGSPRLPAPPAPAPPGRASSTPRAPASAQVAAIELVTIGQRKGLGLPGGGPKRFVVDVDRGGGTVVVGSDDELLRPATDVGEVVWVDGAVDGAGARAVQRPRRATSGDARRPARRRRRAVARSRSAGSPRVRASSSTTPATASCSAAASPRDRAAAAPS